MASKHIEFDYLDKATDIEIDFGDEIFLVHSDVLKSGSRWFEKSLSERWNQGKKDGEDNIYHYYHVTLDPDGEPYLESGSKASSDPQTEETQPLSISSGTASLSSFRTAFKFMINALYREPIILYDTQFCIRLVELADEYDALHAVSPIIQIAILESKGWVDALVHHPLEFLMFAEKLQSKTLFEGAFIHVVGRLVQDPETFSGHEKNLPNETRFLVNDEVMALQRRILKVTYELLGVHAPTNSLSSGRVADILYKVMLGNITRESGSATAANHAKLFRKIHSHHFCPSELLLNDLGKKMSPEIQRNIDSLASTAESLASELTKDCTAFTVNEELDYLTCVEFSDDKFPWKKRKRERLVNRNVG